MAADWEEVKRLAADLQRAQLSSAIQRLSDRNCIEVVNKLIELRLIEVIYTTDGKEYVTPQQVIKEITYELHAHGGRINLVDLAQILNLDFSQVEAKATELVRSDYSLNLVLGQIIGSDYLDRLAEEINEHLQQTGQITVGELTKQYDLPTDYIQQVIDDRLGKIIHGQTDPFDARVIFTDAYLARHRARILGALTAITQPTQILNIINHHGFQERLFHTVVDELLSSGLLAGSVSGGRQDRAVYIPDIYSKAQNEWVDNFFRQNGYLEYDALSRLGITDPENFIKKHLKHEQLTFLKTCVVGSALFDQLEAAMDEALATGTWVDIMLILPSVFSCKDRLQLMQTVLKNRGKQTIQSYIFCDSIVCSDKFIQDLIKPFDDLMITKAEKDAQKGYKYISGESAKSDTVGDCGKKDKKDERRKKAAGGKSGGGTQGRETKTKAVKKKYRTRGGSDDEDEDDKMGAKLKATRSAGEVEFLSVDEITQELRTRNNLEECSDEFLGELADHIHRPLTRNYQDVVRSVFLASAAATGANRRKTHVDLQEKINGLVVNVRLFEKGLKLFQDDIQVLLSKHILKTVCTDITNLIFSFLAQDQMISSNINSNFTNEERLKLISKFPENTTEALTKLNNYLNGKVVDEFVSVIEAATGPEICDMVIKKADKKKERQVAYAYRQGLLEQLSTTMDPALTLHLTSLLLFQVHTHCMLHASGKFVPQILGFLESHLKSDAFQLLQTYQGLVIQQLTLKDESSLSSVKAQLEEMLPHIKEVAITSKKLSQSDQH